MAALPWLQAGEAAAALKSRQLSSVEYVAALLAQHDRKRHLNAFYFLDEEQLRRAAAQSDERRATGAARPLEGVPVAIKDNIGVAGVPNTAGTPGLRSHRPSEHAPIVQRLIDAGALIMGKTAMDELAFGSTCNNAAFGPTRNPFDEERIPGGSSGGSAAAVAAGIAPLALGTDTGGSVRLPAALCGIVGLRPTVGRYPRQGIVPISPTRDTAGPMARCMDDLILIDAVISGEAHDLEPVDPQSLALGLPRAHYRAQLEPAVAAVFEAALQQLRAAGVTLVEADIPSVGELNEQAGFPITFYETSIAISEYLERHGIGLSFRSLAEQAATPNVHRILMDLWGPRAISRARYREALDVYRPALQNAFESYLLERRLDAFVIPTTPLAAARIADGDEVRIEGVPMPTFEAYIRHTSPGSVAGIPGLTMPAGQTPEGLPVGLGLEGGRGADRRLLEIGRALEPILAPAGRPP
jgi:mandelamide amidase